MKWYSRLICILLIISGIFCTMGCIEVWSEKSAVYGTVESIETKNNYSEVAKFDLGTLPFESEDDVNYYFTENHDHIDFNGLENDYSLLFNDNLASDVEVYAGKIVGTIEIKFYDKENVNVSTAKLNVVIEFLDSDTVISISMKNSNNSIAYLTRYTGVHGSVLKIVEKGV